MNYNDLTACCLSDSGEVPEAPHEDVIHPTKKPGCFVGEQGNAFSTKKSRDGRCYLRKLKPEKNHNGYLRVTIGKKHVSMHRLLMEAILKEPIPEGMEIDHINNQRQDNRLSNLQLLSRSENAKKAARRPGWKPMNKRAPVPVIVTDIITGDKAHFPSISRACKTFGFTKATAWNALNKKCMKRIRSAKTGLRYTIDRQPQGA